MQVIGSGKAIVEILAILERKKIMNSGQLYQEYKKVVSKPVVDRAYHKYMKRLLAWVW